MCECVYVWYMRADICALKYPAHFPTSLHRDDTALDSIMFVSSEVDLVPQSRSTTNWVFVLRSAHICISMVTSNKARSASYAVEHHVNMIWLINRISISCILPLCWEEFPQTVQCVSTYLNNKVFDSFFNLHFSKTCSFSSSFSPPFLFLTLSFSADPFFLTYPE